MGPGSLLRGHGAHGAQQLRPPRPCPGVSTRHAALCPAPRRRLAPARVLERSRPQQELGGAGSAASAGAGSNGGVAAAAAARTASDRQQLEQALARGGADSPEPAAAAAAAPPGEPAAGAGDASGGAEPPAPPPPPPLAPLPGQQLSFASYDSGITSEVTRCEGGTYHVRVTGPPGAQYVLHWGCNNWELPPAACIPPGSEQAGDRAVRTPLGGYAGAAAVTLTFEEDLCPERLVFVVHDTASDAWIRDHSANFSLPLRAPCLSALVEGVLIAESSYEHWGLLHRLQRVLELLDAAEAAGPSGMAFVYTWLRLSNAKLLDWSRSFSYQPKDIAWAQQQVSERVAAKARAAADPRVRGYARLALGGLSRGGTHGDEIRHGILNIMRDHGIREGNRPGLDEPWLEQWHQKLHQNTTPEDVIIADAYVAFLQSGCHDDYWRVLNEGGLTQERIESWDQPLTCVPLHLPHLLPAIQHYRWILMTCHAGAELDVALEMARGHLSDDLRWHMYDLAAHRHAWWAPGKCLELRRRLAPMVCHPGAPRDLQLLDIALESWLRLLIERTDRKSLSADDLVELLALVLQNAALTGQHEEMAQVAAQWERVREAPERWSPEWCLAAAAGLGRVQLTLGQFADELCREVQPYAEMFGARCGIAPAHTLNFGEEVVRDQPVFVAALLAAELEPRLRTASGCSPWQVVSQPGLSLSGRVLSLPGLAEVQGAAFNTPTVVLAQALGGMEDIPEGVVGLLTRSSTDVLSHVAIRARCQGVLLATCLDEARWAELLALEGREVELAVQQNGDVTAAATGAAPGAGEQEPDAPAGGAAGGAGGGRSAPIGWANGNGVGGAKAAAPAAADASSPAAPAANGAAKPPPLANSFAAVVAAATGGAAGGPSNNFVLFRFGSKNGAPNGSGAGASNGKPVVSAGPATGRGLFSPPSLLGAASAAGGAGAAVARKWLLQEDEFAPGLVGCKARNLVALRRRLPDWVLVPRSVALPYGCLEAALADPANAETAAKLRDVVSQVEAWGNGGLPGVLLREARSLVAAGLAPPRGMREAVREGLLSAGLIPESGPGSCDSDEDPEWKALFKSVCRVWASKWNDRAWLSRRARRMHEDELRVSVLLQQVLPAHYAFVLHTASPLTGRRGEIFGELVAGLGESLVANHPGRPLSFSDRPDGSATELLTLPSKRTGLFLPGTAPYGESPEGGADHRRLLIARSDTSGEDLEGYAGAGLYDSVPVVPLEERTLDYSKEPLMWDKGFRQDLLDGLVELGCAVEGAFGGQPQDIEGCWHDGRFAVVQARPQVLAPAPPPPAAAAAAPRASAR